MEARQREDTARFLRMQKLRGRPSVTQDGREVQVFANINRPGDMEEVLRNDAQGIGLFRSEFIYLEAQDFPSEEEQFRHYRQVVQAMGDKLVIISTMDVGADKQAPYFQLPHEENPALGLRAIRLCLSRPGLFKTQLRAILRASAFGRVDIMLPMLIDLQELRESRRLLEECRGKLAARGEPVGEVKLGVLVETPAAVMIADELARESDFFFLGTNDLTQYTLAVDRKNARMDAFCDPHHPAILRMIRRTVEAGHRHGIPVGLCGELAADPGMTGALLRTGLDALSVSPAEILPLRRRIRSLNLRQEGA